MKLTLAGFIESFFGEWLGIKDRSPEVWVVAEREISANIQNFRLPVAIVVITAMFLLATHFSASDYQQRLSNWSTNQTAQADMLVGSVVEYKLKDGKFFDSSSAGRDFPIQAPHKLSALAKGLDGELNRPVNISQQLILGSRQDENAFSTVLETPDMPFVVKVLISLLALFFSAETITREKESGTLRTLLANPLRRRDLLSGKALGAAICVIVPTGIAFLCALIYLSVLRGIIFGLDEWARLLLLFALALLYALVFVSLGLLISTFTERTSTALVAGLLVWGAVVLVLPNTTVLIAESAAPLPSYDQVNGRLHQEWDQMVHATLRAHPDATSVFDIPGATGGIISQIERERQVMDDYFARLSRQVETAKWLTALSPAGAVTFGITDLAGTGADTYETFYESLRAGRNQAISNYKKRLNSGPDTGRHGGEAISPATPQRTSSTVVTGLLSAAPCIMSLLLWLSLSMVGAYLRFERYDVR